MDAKGPGFASMPLVSCFSLFQIVRVGLDIWILTLYLSYFLSWLMGLGSFGVVPFQVKG